MNATPHPPVSKPSSGKERLIDGLRHAIRRLERSSEGETRPALPFGVAAMDRHLPEAGLARGVLHEIRGGCETGGGAACGSEAGAAAAVGFAAGILARLNGPVLWCHRQPDLYAPGLAGFGLSPGRVIYAEAADEAAVLGCMEEGLRHASLAAVLGEVAWLPMVASRRLALAAGRSGVMALALHRPRWAAQAARDGPIAATTRWRITPVPGAPGWRPDEAFPCLWDVALTRCRGGEPACWIMEACDAQGRLAVPAELAHRPAASRRAATG